MENAWKTRKKRRLGEKHLPGILFPRKSGLRTCGAEASVVLEAPLGGQIRRLPVNLKADARRLYQRVRGWRQRRRSLLGGGLLITSVVALAARVEFKCQVFFSRAESTRDHFLAPIRRFPSPRVEEMDSKVTSSSHGTTARLIRLSQIAKLSYLSR